VCHVGGKSCGSTWETTACAPAMAGKAMPAEIVMKLDNTSQKLKAEGALYMLSNCKISAVWNWIMHLPASAFRPLASTAPETYKHSRLVVACGAWQKRPPRVMPLSYTGAAISSGGARPPPPKRTLPCWQTAGESEFAVVCGAPFLWFNHRRGAGEHSAREKSAMPA